MAEMVNKATVTIESVGLKPILVSGKSYNLVVINVKEGLPYEDAEGNECMTHSVQGTAYSIPCTLPYMGVLERAKELAALQAAYVGAKGEVKAEDKENIDGSMFRTWKLTKLNLDTLNL